MAIASILALIGGGEGSETAIKTALAAGRGFKCYVEFLHVSVPPESTVTLMGEGVSGATVEEMLRGLQAEGERRARRARELFAALSREAGVARAGKAPEAGRFCAAWRRVTGREYDEVGHRGRLFDLVVVARPDLEEGEGYSAALFETGRPVLVAPPDPPRTVLRRPAAVAWNGSKEAARSIAAALPFLVRAPAVTVLAVENGDAALATTDVMRYLALHKIEARVRIMEPNYRNVGEQLLEAAAEAGAEMLVMGAYGRSRLRELVLGGVTRDVLRAAQMPVVMTH